jgi:hypothetical protein
VFDVLRGDCRPISMVEISRRFVGTRRLHVKAKTRVKLEIKIVCLHMCCLPFVWFCFGLYTSMLLLAFSYNNLVSYIAFIQQVWRGESPGSGSWSHYRTSFWFWGFWWWCDINTHFFCAASIVYSTIKTGGVSEARYASALRLLGDLSQWLNRTFQGLQQSRCIFRTHPPEDGSKVAFRNALLQLCSRRWAVQKEIVSENVLRKTVSERPCKLHSLLISNACSLLSSP